MSPRRDWLGVWFAALREEGEDLDIRYAEVSVGGGAEVRAEVALPHEETDGSGGLQRALGERGLEMEELPAHRRAGQPLGFGRARAVWRELFDSHPWRAEWRRFDRSRIESAPGQNRPVARAFIVFGREVTGRIRSRARALGASVNSLLLAALSESVAPLVLAEGARRLWLVPVDMRGLVKAGGAGNQVAQVPIEVPEGSSPADVHRLVGRAFAEARHFGAWGLVRLSWLSGERRLRAKARAYLSRPGHAWTGTFSNLGRWRVAGLPEGRSWVMFVPVTRSHPLGAACVTLNGRLGLTLQAYPALSTDPAEVQRWLEAWIERVDRELEPA